MIFTKLYNKHSHVSYVLLFLLCFSFAAHAGPVTYVAASPHKDSVFLSCSEVRSSRFFPTAAEL